jgi:hypothetical protein
MKKNIANFVGPLMGCLLIVSTLQAGCGKSSAPQASAPASEHPASPTAASDADMANVLAELSQAVRKYSVEKRQVPATLGEVAAAGYIQNVPQPPPGKSFAIDQKNVKVILK